MEKKWSTGNKRYTCAFQTQNDKLVNRTQEGFYGMRVEQIYSSHIKRKDIS